MNSSRLLAHSSIAPPLQKSTARSSSTVVKPCVSRNNSLKAADCKAMSPVVTAPTRPSNLAAASAFCSAMSEHDAEKLMQILHMHADIVFDEAPMRTFDFIEEVTQTWRGFPDLGVEWTSIVALDEHTVLVKNYRSRGTHTGAYAFGPYPEIPPTNKKVVNDPEDVILKMDEQGRIIKAKFVARGELTGPPGFYKQIGGLIF